MPPAIQYQDVAWFHFGHYLYRMSGDYRLLMLADQKPYEATLQVRVHVNVGFVEDYGFRVSRTRQEPHGLEPHLKAMPHPSNLAHKCVTPNLQRNGITWVAAPAVKLADA
jgi:hypothetical protein